MTSAVYALGAVFHVKSHSAQFEDARVVLRGAGHDFRQGHPAAASINQQAKDFECAESWRSAHHKSVVSHRDMFYAQPSFVWVGGRFTFPTFAC